MDECRTGLGVDPAIAEIIGSDPKSLVMQDHGDACSSEPFKITAVVGTERKYFPARPSVGALAMCFVDHIFFCISAC